MSLDKEEFPNLRQGDFRVTSDPDPAYNCLAWAAGVNNEFWDPYNGVWPDDLPRDFTLATLVMVYQSEGFDLCGDGSLQPECEKIAIYGRNGVYEHASLQLPDGKWTSKLGYGEDIEHTRPESVAGVLYGEVVHFMVRRRKT